MSGEEFTYSGCTYKIEPMCAKDQVDVSIYTATLAAECFKKYYDILEQSTDLLSSKDIYTIADAAIFFFDKLASLTKERFDFCFFKLLSGVKRKEGEAFQVITREDSLIYSSNVISFDTYHVLCWRAFLVNYKDFILSHIQKSKDKQD